MDPLVRIEAAMTWNPSLLVSSRLLPALLVVLAATGCTDEQIVYRDREPFNPPADAAAGFLGYYTPATRQTTCGNCHAEFQSAWRQTRHANAFRSVDQNPNKQESCYSCHTVTSRGNGVTAPAGWDKVKDSTYRDVQCENCHGPGLEHVRGVNRGQLIRPLARIAMQSTSTPNVNPAATCAACHSGAHQPFAEEWTASGHALPPRSTSATCTPCHESRGALAAWGVTANYHEKASTENLATATCAVCHAPHGSSNSRQLRWPISTSDPAQNLCMKCHNRRTVVTTGNPRGNQPHAPQGAVLLGEAGYRPAGFEFNEEIMSSHASSRNPRLCAGCHVDRFQVTDPATGNLVFQATGHLFLAVPCVDAQGRPTASQDCARQPPARQFRACATAGCHATPQAAATVWATTRAEIELFASTIWNDLNRNEVIDLPPTDLGYLPTIRQTRPSEINPNDARISAADGAEFNMRLCGENRYALGDNSRGVHNPFLCKQLLIANILELRQVYGLPAPPAEVQQLLQATMLRLGAREVADR
jgi:predicted CXXCH cytochrome family protein